MCLNIKYIVIEQDNPAIALVFFVRYNYNNHTANIKHFSTFISITKRQRQISEENCYLLLRYVKNFNVNAIWRH